MSTLNLLLNNDIISLFTVISLGMLLGKVQMAKISLGNSAIIFVALILGHFNYSIPEGIGPIGLVLFIYCVGIGAGPGFFGAFAKHGAKIAELSLFIVSMAAVMTYIIAKVFQLPIALSVGILAGALTSTPALAAGIDSLKDSGSLVSVGYGIAYPFGVIGVVLFVQLLPRILRKDLQQISEDEKNKKQSHINRYYVEVLNPGIIGKRIAETEIIKKSSCQISRIFENGRFIPLQRDTEFSLNAILLLVGDEKNAESIIDLIGRKSDKIKSTQIESERLEVVVSSEKIVGKTIRELDLLSKHGVTITRVNRLEMIFVPGLDTVLEKADRLTVVGDGPDLSNFAKTAGHRTKTLHETDLISLSMGILLGVFIGMIPLALPGTKTITLGMSGGPLLVALLLGHYGRVGNIVGRIPFGAQYLMRELGLVFFLAHAGIKAGNNFVPIIQQYGIILFIYGMAVTIIPLLGGFLFAKYIFKLDFLEIVGGLCGGMTSTPGLGAVTTKTDSDVPITSYATAYPISLVFIIIVVQLLISLVK